MRIIPPTLDIEEDEGFTKEKDIFDRGTIGKGLTNIICQVTHPLVIAIDNEWGTGKTTFLKMWAGELRKQEIPVVFFDAFQHDYVEDAFTAIAGEIISLATQKQKQNDPAAKKFVKSSVGAAKILLRTGLKIGVKLATAGVLDAADMGKAASDFAKEASDLEDKYLGELITEQKAEKQALQSFRDALELLPALLTPLKSDSQEPSKTKPLVIIIDELDRCRPPFALQILERIKHFFSVPGVHFVLGTHLGQLRNSVSAVYGPGIESAKYLQKFIDFTLHLTESTNQPHRRTSTIYIDHLLAVMFPDRQPEATIDLAKQYYRHLAHKTGLSLRSIEKIISSLAISLAYRPVSASSFDPIVIGLCALKVISPELYVSAKTGAKIFHEVKIPLGLTITPEQREKNTVEYIAKFWQYFSDPHIAEKNPEFANFSGIIPWRSNLERWDVVSYVARSMVDRLAE